MRGCPLSSSLGSRFLVKVPPYLCLSLSLPPSLSLSLSAPTGWLTTAWTFPGGFFLPLFHPLLVVPLHMQYSAINLQHLAALPISATILHLHTSPASDICRRKLSPDDCHKGDGGAANGVPRWNKHAVGYDKRHQSSVVLIRNNGKPAVRGKSKVARGSPGRAGVCDKLQRPILLDTKRHDAVVAAVGTIQVVAVG